MAKNYKAVASVMFVTDPDGQMTERPTMLYVCPSMTKGGTVGVKLVGDGPLKGYMIDLRLEEVNRCIASGAEIDTLPEKL